MVGSNELGGRRDMGRQRGTGKGNEKEMEGEE